MTVIDPVSTVFVTLGRGAEIVSDLAFNSAVKNQPAEPKHDLSPRDLALLAIHGGRPQDAPGVGIQEAEEARLIKRDADGQFYLSALGEYLLPEPVDDRSGTEATPGPPPGVAAH